MNVLVDSCVWSLSLRRQAAPRGPGVAELEKLIGEFRVSIIGPIRQEVLSGIREPGQFARLKQHLGFFRDIVLVQEDYELAADYFNKCRQRGIQGSNTDFLICAVAARHALEILTTDGDFQHFARHLPIKLHKIRLPRSGK